MSKEKQSNMSCAKSHKSFIGANARSVLYALLIALIIRSFVFQPFNIPSGSMLPTLFVGDYIFVSKYSYGFSKHSFPFSLAPFSGRIPAGKIARGDVAVFKLPSDNATDYIKRVIGLPGDTIQMRNGLLHINGVAVGRQVLAPFMLLQGTRHRPVARYKETLPNGVSYETLDIAHKENADNTRIYHVPEGHYFMMGDNRDNSLDSRFQPVGYVPYDNFVGKARIKFYSFDDKASFFEVWKYPSAIRWSRIFAAVR